jgi:hypothetical protein
MKGLKDLGYFIIYLSTALSIVVGGITLSHYMKDGLDTFSTVTIYTAITITIIYWASKFVIKAFSVIWKKKSI